MRDGGHHVEHAQLANGHPAMDIFHGDLILMDESDYVRLDMIVPWLINQMGY
jgi:hypothetical protein